MWKPVDALAFKIYRLTPTTAGECDAPHLIERLRGAAP